MKKSFVLLTILLLLGTGVVCYAQTNILTEKDQVNFTENIHYGNKGIADGITVEMKNDWRRMLFWNSTYVIGNKPSVTTDYDFYPWKVDKGQYFYEGSIELTGSELVSSNWEKLGELATGLDVAMLELSQKVQPGEEISKTIYVKDYLEFYPFSVSACIPQLLNYENEDGIISYHWDEKELLSDIAYNEKHEVSKEVIAESKKTLSKMQAFMEFFKIPVIENDVMKIAVGKEEDGTISGWATQNSCSGTSCNNVDIEFFDEDYEKYDSFWFRIESVLQDGDCYFTFDPYTDQQRKLVDTSHIPGGYGIYHFDYDEKTGELYPEHLKMVYALDVSEHLYDIGMDVRGKNLLLTTEKDSNIYLSIIDIDTMTLRDRVLVSKDDYLHGYWLYEDYMVLYAEELMVWEIDENGNYMLQFSVPMDKVEEITSALAYPLEDEHHPMQPIFFLREDSVTDWNGKQLVICNALYNEAGNKESSFYVAIVDETGLCYLASYKGSLVTAESYGACEPSREEPLKVYWNKEEK